MDAFVKTLKSGQECLVSGQGATTQNGLPKWKKATAKLGPAKTRRQVFIDALVSTVDPVTDVTTYRHINTPENVNTGTNFALIIRKDKGGKPILLIRNSRVGELVFTQQLTFKVDGEVIKVATSPKFDISDQIEWDVLPAEEHKQLVKALLSTKQAVTMRYTGHRNTLIVT